MAGTFGSIFRCQNTELINSAITKRAARIQIISQKV